VWEPDEIRRLNGQTINNIIEKEDDGYVALCLEIDVASRGDTVGEARENLKKHLELFLKLLHKKKSIQDSMVKCM